MTHESATLNTIAPEKLIGTNEAAEHLGLSPRTLEDWRRRGVGPKFYRIGRGRKVVRYRRSDLDAYANGSGPSGPNNGVY